ncbi:hypothetical protein HEK616_77680 (plasmid) [Streptomyces nigrescens]|uniref:Uncharacterized protein n=1 Tax=Streptomyces nigrescens TaxID=1920 RepID=A0ABM8A6M9_STRNI|nr:hypothetical protein HEK616_77680 [Streptomyces nigrescens]
MKDVAEFAPKRTLVAPVKFAPVTVTLVPPATDPEPGETESTEGGGTARAENTFDRLRDAFKGPLLRERDDRCQCLARREDGCSGVCSGGNARGPAR